MDNIVTFLSELGVFSAICGIFVWRIRVYFEKRDLKRDAVDADNRRLLWFLIRGNNVSIELGRANAEAIRDGHCNGNVSSALESAKNHQDDMERFMTEQGIDNLKRSA